MKNQLSLGIKTPCSENFNQFKSTSKGGFCDTCNKEVIDFTKMNSQEIITYFKTNSNLNTCGRFNGNQLTTYESQPKRINKFSVLSGIGLACLSLFSFNVAQAQDTPENRSSKMITQNQEKGILVKGNVSETSLPLGGVNIVLEGSTFGTQTDFDGNFEFPEKLKKGDVLIFSYLGLTTQKIVVAVENSASEVELKIDMKMDSFTLMGEVSAQKVYKSKRN